MRKLLITGVLIAFCFSPILAQNMDSLIFQATNLIDQNRPQEAAIIMENIVAKDTTNYDCYAFLGNYHFLLGENAIKKADADYQAIAEPTRMQMAHYQDVLKQIYYTDYVKADLYLTKALNLKKNDHLKKLTDSILAFKRKIGLNAELGKKKITKTLKTVN